MGKLLQDDGRILKKKTFSDGLVWYLLKPNVINVAVHHFLSVYCFELQRQMGPSTILKEELTSF